MLPADLEKSAREWGVLQRRREIKSADDLIRVALLYGFCDDSLRQTALHAALAGVANMSDVAVLDRLRIAGSRLRRYLCDSPRKRKRQSLSTVPTLTKVAQSLS